MMPPLIGFTIDTAGTGLLCYTCWMPTMPGHLIVGLCSRGRASLFCCIYSSSVSSPPMLPPPTASFQFHLSASTSSLYSTCSFFFSSLSRSSQNVMHHSADISPDYCSQSVTPVSSLLPSLPALALIQSSGAALKGAWCLRSSAAAVISMWLSAARLIAPDQKLLTLAPSFRMHSLNCSQWKYSALGGVKKVSNPNKGKSRTRDRREGWMGEEGWRWRWKWRWFARCSEKKGKFRVPQSAYKYSINFSQLHNGMAVQLCIQCLESEMKL